jgi:sugar lactone lactonase YvrE
MTTPDVAAASQDILGESPIWCEREQALFWVDIRAPALRRLDPRDGRVRSWALPELCGGVALSGLGRVVLSLRSGLAGFELATGKLSPLVALERPELDNRLNDTKCDRRGRLWVGTMRDYGAARTGSLYRIAPDLACERLLSAIAVPNALCWSPDDKTMYFADTADGRLRAYDFDADSGRLGAMRVLLEAGSQPGRPDGATVDVEGCIWNARYGGGAILRLTPAGDVDRCIDIPAAHVTACTFGGSDLRTLYVTTARQRLTAAELERQPLAGNLFALNVGVAGLPEPRFLPRV